ELLRQSRMDTVFSMNEATKYPWMFPVCRLVEIGKYATPPSPGTGSAAAGTPRSRNTIYRRPPHGWRIGGPPSAGWPRQQGTGRQLSTHPHFKCRWLTSMDVNHEHPTESRIEPCFRGFQADWAC